MLTISDIIDNFLIQYDGIKINTDLATIWANDCAKKFVTVEGNTELKAKMIDIVAERGNLDKDFYKIAQVWFNPWKHGHDKMAFLKSIEQDIANKYAVTGRILKDCSNDIEERCYLDLSKVCTTEYYQDPVLNAIHNQLTFISQMGTLINTDIRINSFKKFVFVLPDITGEHLLDGVIPCADQQNYISNIRYRITKNKYHIYINYPEGLALILYYAIPLDKDGNVMVPDNSNVINAIYNYILWQNSLKDFVLNYNNENRIKIDILRKEYLRNLLLGKKDLEQVDPKVFGEIYNKVMHTVLGRDMDYNPFSYYGD